MWREQITRLDRLQNIYRKPHAGLKFHYKYSTDTEIYMYIHQHYVAFRAFLKDTFSPLLSQSHKCTTGYRFYTDRYIAKNFNNIAVENRVSGLLTFTKPPIFIHFEL
jgi:hypothetical protein